MEYVPPLNGNLADPNRSYINANPGTGTEGSIPKAEAIEHPMREIVNAIIAAGITPDDGDLTQLYDAMVAIAAANVSPDASTTVKGKVELATDAEYIAGTDTVRAVTPSNFSSNQSLGANGYKKLAGGLILQWGTASVGSETAGVNTTVTFPVAFTTQARVAFATQFAGPKADNSNTPQMLTQALTNFVVYNQWTGNGVDEGFTLNWIAIGY